MRSFKPNKPFPTIPVAPTRQPIYASLPEPTQQTLGTPIGVGGLSVGDFAQFVDCYPQICAGAGSFKKCAPNLTASPDYSCIASKAIPLALAQIIPGLPSEEVKATLSDVPNDPEQLITDVNNFVTGLLSVISSGDVAGFFTLIDNSPPWIQKLATGLLSRFLLKPVGKLITPVLPGVSDDDLRKALVLVSSREEFEKLPAAIADALNSIQAAIANPDTDAGAASLKSYLSGTPGQMGLGALSDYPQGTQEVVKMLMKYGIAEVRKATITAVYNLLQSTKAPILKDIPRENLDSVLLQILSNPASVGGKFLDDVKKVIDRFKGVKGVADVFKLATDLKKELGPDSVVGQIVVAILDFLFTQAQKLKGAIPVLNQLSLPQIAEAVANNIGDIPEVITKLGSMDIRTLDALKKAASGVGVAGIGLGGLSAGAKTIVQGLVTQLESGGETVGQVLAALKKYKNGDLLTVKNISQGPLRNVKAATYSKLLTLLNTYSSADDLAKNIKEADFSPDPEDTTEYRQVKGFVTALQILGLFDRSALDAFAAKQKQLAEQQKKQAKALSGNAPAVVTFPCANAVGGRITSLEKTVFDAAKKSCDAGAGKEWFDGWLAWANQPQIKTLPANQRSASAYAQAILDGRATPPTGWVVAGGGGGGGQNVAPVDISKLDTTKQGNCGIDNSGLTTAEQLVWAFNNKTCAPGNEASQAWKAGYEAWKASKTQPQASMRIRARLSGSSGPLSEDAYAKEILSGKTAPPTGWQQPTQTFVQSSIQQSAPSAAPSSTSSTSSSGGSDNTPLIIGGLAVAGVLAYLAFGTSKTKSNPVRRSLHSYRF